MVEVESFYKYLISKGYYFDKELIENYLLSLKVKPFEILTGNSGTGKTKLAQLFAQFVNDRISHIPETGGYLTVKAKTNYSSWANMGWTLSKEDFDNVLPLRNCEVEFDMLVDSIPAQGKIDVGVQLYYASNDLKKYFKELNEKDDKSVIDMFVDCKDIQKILTDYESPNGSIVITQKSNKTAINDRQWTMSNKIFNYFPFKKVMSNVM